jgi:hypothetical protein
VYGFLWRHLPGRPVVKGAQCLVLAAMALLACVLWLFPMISHQLADGAVLGR